MRLNLLYEGIGNYRYSVPENKEQLLFDFYTYSGLQGLTVDRPQYGSAEFIPLVMQEIGETLLPSLKAELLNVVLFAIASEIRHGKRHLSQPSLEQIHAEHPEFYENVINWRQDSEPFTALYDKDESRNAAMFRAEEFIERTSDVEFVSICKDAFNAKWASMSFGGSSWAKICNGWLKLKAAKGKNELLLWIDHLYDLQHNTGTVLNKMKEYAIDGDFEWIKQALDYKRDIADVRSILDHASSQMRRIAAFIIKSRTGETLEAHKGETPKAYPPSKTLWNRYTPRDRWVREAVHWLTYSSVESLRGSEIEYGRLVDIINDRRATSLTDNIIDFLRRMIKKHLEVDPVFNEISPEKSCPSNR